MSRLHKTDFSGFLEDDDTPMTNGEGTERAVKRVSSPVLLKCKTKIIVSDPCPDAGRTDPYTGQQSFYGCLVNHFHYEEKEMNTQFDSEDAANDFIKGAPENCTDFQIFKLAHKPNY